LDRAYTGYNYTFPQIEISYRQGMWKLGNYINHVLCAGAKLQINGKPSPNKSQKYVLARIQKTTV